MPMIRSSKDPADLSSKPTMLTGKDIDLVSGGMRSQWFKYSDFVGRGGAVYQHNQTNLEFSYSNPQSLWRDQNLY